jgi:RNA polymerase sigma-70 factor, ECF subfamily
LEKLGHDLIDFTLIYNRHKSRLYFYVLKMVNERMVTEDIVQNVFIKLYENLGRIRQKESITPWIYKTARNEVYEFLRKKINKHEQRIDEDEPVSGNQPDSDYEIKELKELIMTELSNVPEEQKEVYLLKEYSGLSYKEIADIQNIDEELVKSRLFKVRQKLIKRISKLV